jgi:tryptophan-rich sensory protein
MNKHKILKLIFCIAISELAGGVGSLFTTSKIPTWYSTIIKPTFSPPNWIFGPVWTMLFLLMGIALYLVWQQGIHKNHVKVAAGLFALQLVLNIFWSIIFFGLQNPGGAFVEIIFLWAAILATIIAFYKVSKTAALLMVPYIMWVSFAAILNYYIWILNT